MKASVSVRILMAAATVSALCQEKSVSFPIYNDLAHQRYLLNLTVGTPPQPYSLTVDSGSADFWLPLPNSTGCAPQACPAGTYDPADSQSSKELGLPFNATMGITLGLNLEGAYVNDTVQIGDVIIPDLTIGAVNVPPILLFDGLWGGIGLGPPSQENLYSNPASPLYHQLNGTFPTLWEQLYLNGYISRRLLSVWMNRQSEFEGTIDFGGTDKSKYIGDLKSVGLNLGPQVQFTSWAVNLTSVRYLDGNGGGENLTENGWSIEVVLDTGSPNMYLPTVLYDSLANYTGARMVQGFPYVLCSVRNSSEALQFGLGVESSGPQIWVPFGEIIYPFGLPANIGEVRDETGEELCYLGLIGTGGRIFLLGATFFRSAYTVFDVDGLQVSMAQASFF